jgi:hypothetical protein
MVGFDPLELPLEGTGLDQRVDDGGQYGALPDERIEAHLGKL